MKKLINIFFRVIQLLYQVQDHRHVESCDLHNLQGLYRYNQRTNHKKKKKLKKRGPDIDPCGTPDSTLLYSLNEELMLTL